MIGEKNCLVFCAASSTSWAGFARSAAIDGAPTEATNAAPAFSASPSGASDSVPPPAEKNAPLSPMAL